LSLRDLALFRKKLATNVDNLFQFRVLESAKRIDRIERTMARNLRELKEAKSERAPRVKLSAKESLKRTQEFDKRKEQFIAAVRKGKS